MSAELSGVFGCVLSPHDRWECVACAAEFHAEETVYPDPRARQGARGDAGDKQGQDPYKVRLVAARDSQRCRALKVGTRNPHRTSSTAASASPRTLARVPGTSSMVEPLCLCTRLTRGKPCPIVTVRPAARRSSRTRHSRRTRTRARSGMRPASSARTAARGKRSRWSTLLASRRARAASIRARTDVRHRHRPQQSPCARLVRHSQLPPLLAPRAAAHRHAAARQRHRHAGAGQRAFVQAWAPRTSSRSSTSRGAGAATGRTTSTSRRGKSWASACVGPGSPLGTAAAMPRHPRRQRPSRRRRDRKRRPSKLYRPSTARQSSRSSLRLISQRRRAPRRRASTFPRRHLASRPVASAATLRGITTSSHRPSERRTRGRGASRPSRGPSLHSLRRPSRSARHSSSARPRSSLASSRRRARAHCSTRRPLRARQQQRARRHHLAPPRSASQTSSRVSTQTPLLPHSPLCLLRLLARARPTSAHHGAQSPRLQSRPCPSSRSQRVRAKRRSSSVPRRSLRSRRRLSRSIVMPSSRHRASGHPDLPQPSLHPPLPRRPRRALCSLQPHHTATSCPRRRCALPTQQPPAAHKPALRQASRCSATSILVQHLPIRQPSKSATAATRRFSQARSTSSSTATRRRRRSTRTALHATSVRSRSRAAATSTLSARSGIHRCAQSYSRRACRADRSLCSAHRHPSPSCSLARRSSNTSTSLRGRVSRATAVGFSSQLARRRARLVVASASTSTACAVPSAMASLPARTRHVESSRSMAAFGTLACVPPSTTPCCALTVWHCSARRRNRSARQRRWRFPSRRLTDPWRRSLRLPSPS